MMSDLTSVTPKYVENMYHISIYVKNLGYGSALFSDMADGGHLEF